MAERDCFAKRHEQEMPTNVVEGLIDLGRTIRRAAIARMANEWLTARKTWDTEAITVAIQRATILYELAEGYEMEDSVDPDDFQWWRGNVLGVHKESTEK